MASLITNKMGGTPKSSNDVFINELNGAFCCVIVKCLNFYPLSGVVSGYNNILITSSLSCGFTLQQKGAILRFEYHRKQQRKKFPKARCCEP
jgi:hypothetical protein